MYGRMNGEKPKGDGTFYAPSYSYVCRSHFAETSVVCPKAISYSEKTLAKAVRDIIVSLVHDDGFHDLVERSLTEKFDADILAADIEAAQKEWRRLQRLQEQIENQLNAIDYDSKNAAKLEESYNNRLFKVIEDITETEARIEYLSEQMEHAQSLEDAKAGIYDFLQHFEEIYDMMENVDKRDFLKSFIDSIELYPKEKGRKGQWIKTIHFLFPMQQKDGELCRSVSFAPDSGENSKKKKGKGGKGGKGGGNGTSGDTASSGSGGSGGGTFPTLASFMSSRWHSTAITTAWM